MADRWDTAIAPVRVNRTDEEPRRGELKATSSMPRRFGKANNSVGNWSRESGWMSSVLQRLSTPLQILTGASRFLFWERLIDVKFVNCAGDLDYSTNKNSICQFMLTRAKLPSDFVESEFWEKAKTWVMCTICRCRSDKANQFRIIFYGKLC